MNISVIGATGKPVKSDLYAQTVLAVQSFARQLGISRLKLNLEIQLFHKVFLDDQGTEGDCYPVSNRLFTIRTAMYGHWLSTLAHEMVHVKQFAKGELDPMLTSWKSNKYCSNIDYWDQPWEKEARRLQDRLVSKFIEELNQ